MALGDIHVDILKKDIGLECGLRGSLVDVDREAFSGSCSFDTGKLGFFILIGCKSVRNEFARQTPPGCGERIERDPQPQSLLAPAEDLA